MTQPIGNHFSRKAANGANYGAYERRLFQNRKLNQIGLAISIQTKYLSQ